MGSIHDGSCISSIISGCGFILGSARNSTNTASNNLESFVEVNFVNASVFTFLDHRLTLIEAMGKVSISPFAFSKYMAILSPRARQISFT